jgi:DNA modification methylase
MSARRPPPRPPRPPPTERRFARPEKPPLRLQTTTLWEYPSQHYGDGVQGDPRYVGATPSYVIWNVLQRYSQPGDLVVDPMCGSGTTLDVCRDTGRRGRGFDVAPYRADIEAADARKLPLKAGEAQLVFVDPPYGDHIHYSEDPRCIGKLSAYDPRFYEEMGKVLRECARVLRPDGVLAIYCCDYFEKKKGLASVGFELFALALRDLTPIDHVAVVRHHKTLNQGNFHRAAEEGNFFLRGFNHLFLLRKGARRAG